MSRLEDDYGVTIVGGGPAGLAPLLAAHRLGSLSRVLDRGVAILEQSDSLGGGDIGRYAINSDSTGTTFVDCLRSTAETPLTKLRNHPLSLKVAATGDGPVPLALVGLFMSLVGQTLGGMVAAHPRCSVLRGYCATSVQQAAGGWTTIAESPSQGRISVRSRCVVSATGAHQPRERLAREAVGGINLAQRHGGKLLQSGDVFVAGGLAAIAGRLARCHDPRVVIIGGSTSAAAAAHALLHRLPSIRFGDAAITLMHRRPLRIYYPSADEALDEGYDEFDDHDICPISKRVFRFAGFRLDSRELIMQARGIGGRAPEPRLALHRLCDPDHEAAAKLDRADLIVAALGYRPRAIQVLDLLGDPIDLLARQQPQAPLVDGQCRVLDAERVPIPGLFGIGLAAGFVPRGNLGGEPSFSGQANGLWLWQNDVGALIVDGILAQAEPERAASVSARHRAEVLA